MTRSVRKGTKRAQTVSEIQELLARARRTNIGLMHMISLALHLGLRRKEDLMCPRDLQMWLDAPMHGESSIPLMRGAKKARPRDARMVQSNRQDTIEAIRSALTYCQEHDFELITGSGKALKSAMNRLKALLRRTGMVGQVSFHSLRYTYALRKVCTTRFLRIAQFAARVVVAAKPPGPRSPFCSNRRKVRLPKFMASAPTCFTLCAVPYAPSTGYPTQTAS